MEFETLFGVKGIRFFFISVSDSGVVDDIDTPADYRRLLGEIA